jgi:CRP-like cAMP-binding protein
VLVGEGAPGESMFIIVSGRAKAYVRDRKGNYMKIKELSDGDFFGEVSVLTGKPRTATITAATEVELLELDKTTLDGITQRYPRVREILQEFQKKRAQEAVEAIIRGKD